VTSISIIWKVVIKDFDLIENGLVWRIGLGNLVRIGLDPWDGSNQEHIINDGVRYQLEHVGFFIS
jgi:hypothetical protein